jgi:hypothetical protein
MDYSRSYMMFNYLRIDPGQGMNYDNLKCIRTFTDIPDEVGFILTHCAIVGFSPQIVQCCEGILNCVENDKRHQLNLYLEELISIQKQVNQQMK